jgi:HD superfamily phosphohydrolase
VPPVGTIILRDVLHGYIFLDSFDKALLDCLPVQRLRYIRQNDVAYLVFPSLNTSRLEHSLGVMHVAGQIAEGAFENARPGDRKRYLSELIDAIPYSRRPKSRQDASRAFIRASRWYGLLHDLGHLPFSHLTEHSISHLLPRIYASTSFSKLHEAACQGLVTGDHELSNALNADRAAAWIVEKLIASKKAEPEILQPVKDILDSEVDADRIDSTARDGLLAGGDFGHYDTTRLIRNACLIEIDSKWRIYFTTRAISSLESLLVERYKTHRWIHYHPKVTALKNAFRHCVSSLKWSSERWHCNNYVRNNGFFDDAMLLDAIWRSKSSHLDVQNARKAVLMRRRTAWPLWKRRDEFRTLSEQVAGGRPEWRELDRSVRLLNRLAPEVVTFEDILNTDPPNGLHFLVSKTQLTPYELVRVSQTEQQGISKYMVIEHKSRKHNVLTRESRLVESLYRTVEEEPGIAVTVLNEDTRNESDVRSYFIEKARQAVREIVTE